VAPFNFAHPVFSLNSESQRAMHSTAYYEEIVTLYMLSDVVVMCLCCVPVQLNRKLMMTEDDLERSDKKANASDEYVISRDVI